MTGLLQQWPFPSPPRRAGWYCGSGRARILVEWSSQTLTELHNKAPAALRQASSVLLASRLRLFLHSLENHNQESLDLFPDAGILGFPIPRDVQPFDLRVPAYHSTTSDARTTSLDVTIITGFRSRLQASSVVLASGVSDVPNQSVPSLSRTFCSVRPG